MVFKLIIAVMVALLTYAIVVQLNDADMLFWTAMYGVSVITSVGDFMNLPLRPMLWVAFGLYAAAVVFYSPSFAYTSLEAFASVGMSGEEQERVRELWGMVVCLLWTGILIIHDMLKFPLIEYEDDFDDADVDDVLCN